jgi:hypothetical protein
MYAATGIFLLCRWPSCALVKGRQVYVIQVSWLHDSKQSTNLYNISLMLYVQSWTPDDGRKDLPKQVEWCSINSKVVHLVGFTIEIYHDARSHERQTYSRYLWDFDTRHLESIMLRTGYWTVLEPQLVPHKDHSPYQLQRPIIEIDPNGTYILTWNISYFCPILTKLESQQIFITNTKYEFFTNISPRRNRSALSGRTDMS